MRGWVGRGSSGSRLSLLLHISDESRQRGENILIRLMLLNHPGRDVGRAMRREHSGVMGAEMLQPGVQEADGELLVPAQRADDLVH